jgi:hypothetical protein
MPVILATWEGEVRSIMVQGHPGKYFERRPSPKIIRAKWTGCVAQALQAQSPQFKLSEAKNTSIYTFRLPLSLYLV